MGHPANGTIRAFLDGEATGEFEDTQAHLAQCPQCRTLAREQSLALDSLSEALALLDVEPPLETIRVRLLREMSGGRRGWGTFRRNLPRAASFAILLTAGAAAALPGSPVRRWVTRGWDAVSGSGETTEAVSPSPSATEGTDVPGPEVGTVGATIPAGADGLELHVRELAGTASLRILLVEGSQAGIFGGEGTRFRTEAGRVIATGPPGDVTMEIPMEASPVLVVVNGEVYLRKTEEGLELLGPVLARTPTEIRFGPSGAGTNGPAAGG